ncbi:MAG: HoxN/HupN/NixA family nickel/cobalt transporter [Solirubrobacterales bacterium]|nr:MAG: HoxN/HupN/NixA family nickel/cobalt transporter [Solirubrobacterales bacterium]
MTPGEWRRAAGMVAVIGGLHVIGFGILILVVAPQHYRLGSTGTFAIGTGITAYTLGLRHAFDADHVSAIDNTTRKLMSEGKRPLSVGFFFSLGHSTIVFTLALLLAIGVKALSGSVQNGQSTLHKATNVIGTTVSGTFLYMIAALNIVILVSILRIFFEMRAGKYDEEQLEQELNSRGFMNRLFGRFTKAVKQPWQMYPVGMLFGLGFDTASEVALLVLAGSAGAAGLPFYAILCLPVLFAAGMSLLDTIDGSFMNFAYGWAFSKPVRKVYYNITITGLSIAVAMFIGTIELVGLITDKLGLKGSVVDWFQNFNINTAGLIIVGMFVATWLIALAVWRFARIEEKWTAGMEAGASPKEIAAVDG